MSIIFAGIYLIVGLVQIIAIMSGVEYSTGIDGFFGFVIAAFVTYIPFLGSGLGVFGAINVWDWHWVPAMLLFFWYVPASLIFFVLASRER